MDHVVSNRFNSNHSNFILILYNIIQFILVESTKNNNIYGHMRRKCIWICIRCIHICVWICIHCIHICVWICIHCIHICGENYIIRTNYTQKTNTAKIPTRRMAMGLIRFFVLGSYIIYINIYVYILRFENLRIYKLLHCS